ncbi:MAG: peptidoglycan DD-metalloendopeptidase family protein [Deltaproteobacteria bacterium]|nr:peptidoglycan DD-metalloendopeptidase family protein [Deltaproteobacteria bacterium]
MGFALAFVLGVGGEPSLLDALERIDRKLQSAQTRLDEIETQRVVQHKELAALEADLAAATVRKEEALAQFRRRLNALARMPAGARLVLLGGSRSLADYLETTRVLRWVAMHDRKLHDMYVAERDRLRTIDAAARARKDALLAVEARARQERDELAARRQERMEMLSRVSGSVELLARAARERDSGRGELAAMVRRLTPAGAPRGRFSENRGRLPWPAAGVVSMRFAERVQHAPGMATVQQGLDIRAQAGARVQAVAAGEVAHVGWLKGYGQLVIVDHGEGYHTLAAHLASVSVAAGEHVETGVALGTVGDTGSLRGTVLYFELRRQGVPIDPAPWLRR